MHYPLVEKLDTYAGLMVGCDIVSAKETGTTQFGFTGSANASSFIISGFVGARYFLLKNLVGFQN